MTEKIIPKHGGYRKLKTFQLARLVYDVTVRFCDKFISKRSRTHDQMVQAARSGVQNIAEGSQASGTSKKTELILTNVARSSLEELFLDYEDFLRQNNFKTWNKNDSRRQEFIAKRLVTANEVARWSKELSLRDPDPIPQVAANLMLVLIEVTCYLLSRQISSLADSFQEEGGFNERLYKLRKKKQRSQNNR